MSGGGGPAGDHLASPPRPVVRVGLRRLLFRSICRSVSRAKITPREMKDGDLSLELRAGERRPAYFAAPIVSAEPSLEISERLACEDFESPKPDASTRPRRLQ